MGLDIVLGFVILSSAIRGWMRGFLMQGIRLAGLVGCLFAASPVREFARPYVAKQLSSIRPELLDRMLWWAAAVATYVVTTGVAILAVRMYRKRTFGLEEANRSDQFAGFLFGGLKGLVVACFLVAGLQRFALDRIKGIDWAEEQAKTSRALALDTQYHPAEKIWTAPPVQKLLAHVRVNGLQPTGSESVPSIPLLNSGESEGSPVATANRPPRLEIPDPQSSQFKEEFDRLFGDLEKINKLK